MFEDTQRQIWSWAAVFPLLALMKIEAIRNIMELQGLVEGAQNNVASLVRFLHSGSARQAHAICWWKRRRTMCTTTSTKK